MKADESNCADYILEQILHELEAQGNLLLNNKLTPDNKIEGCICNAFVNNI